MIIHDSSVSGPHNPVTPAPPRVPGSLRRTSTIDTFRPDGFDGEAQVIARARDAFTNPDGSATTVATARIDARLRSRAHNLLAIESEPAEPGLQALLESVVGPGFRRRVDDAVPELRDRGELLYLLLDDLPGATLVSGYSMLHADAVPRPTNDEYLGARADLCAGWANDGAMMNLIRTHGQSPAPMGPAAPALERTDDPDAWHELPALTPNAMRRIRRLDVVPSETKTDVYLVDVFFRDSHVDPNGRETIVHEYSVTAAVDGQTRSVLAIDAVADVLPWQECPGALASAARLVGRPLAGLRPHVATFVGTSTCTHLNDVLRGLTDIDAMIDTLIDTLSR